MSVAEEMRQAADLLEKFNRLYAVDNTATGEWSPQLLREQADYLGATIPLEES